MSSYNFETSFYPPPFKYTRDIMGALCLALRLLLALSSASNMMQVHVSATKRPFSWKCLLTRSIRINDHFVKICASLIAK